MPEELWTRVCDIVQEAVIKTILRKKECKKAKWFSEEALHIADKRRDGKGKEAYLCETYLFSVFSSVQSLSRVRLSATP